VAPARRDRKIVKVGSYENYASGDRGGQYADAHRNARMETNPRSFHRALNRRFKTQVPPQEASETPIPTACRRRSQVCDAKGLDVVTVWRK
jgi:hypothetical protein